ncbi:unnamed protein product [Echinostoma caproni]|uniref:LRRCT domain-containing protein n=1 Tax=Echinostoma caproni TaxID=27848 RepID=A0A183B088_9TREM|nr:unnamed protein product [Echinostoma caproni]
MVDVKSHLNPEPGTLRTMTHSTQNEQPGVMQAHELGKYLVILSIIAASNIVFFIVGAITYKCIKCRHRVRRKSSPPTASQGAYVLSNGQTNPAVTHPLTQTQVDTTNVMSLLSVPSVSQQMTNPMISNSNMNHLTEQYNYPVPNWQQPTISTTWSGPDILGPCVPGHSIYSNKPTLSSHIGQDLTHILSPHRTKRLHMFGEPSSPISSDMGYSASTSSRTADRSDPSADRGNTMYRPGRPESSSKPYNHYTLTLKQGNCNKAELVYEPTIAEAEKPPNTLRINAPCMRETSLAPQTQWSQRIKESLEKGLVLDNTDLDLKPSPNSILKISTEELDPTCPIHGTEPQHTCAVHSNPGEHLCPVHDSMILDTSDIERKVKELCALNEKYRHYSTWISDRKPAFGHSRYSNPNLNAINLDYMSASDLHVSKAGKSALRNNTLPR